MTKYPYLTTAKFASVCPETGKPIKKGDPIAYDPAKKLAYHNDSQVAQEIRSQNAARAFCLADGEW